MSTRTQKKAKPQNGKNRQAEKSGRHKLNSATVEPPPAASSVRQVRDRLGVSRELFARLSGFSVRTIAEWEGGKVPAAARTQRMTELERLQQGLAKVMKPDFIGLWLQTPNAAFSGFKPVEIIERGEVDRLWRMIYELESGTPS